MFNLPLYRKRPAIFSTLHLVLHRRIARFRSFRVIATELWN